MNKARYSVGTWDHELQAYTPQRGAGRCVNITIHQVRRVLHRLRRMGFTADRTRFVASQRPGDFDWTSDHDVLVERTDGMTKAEILEAWRCRKRPQ